jgi:hypothetical protein
MRSTDKTTEAARVMSICNACRYCEGHCAVFQAMELRLEFNAIIAGPAITIANMLLRMNFS